MKIKVILQSDVAGLGEEGDVKEVAGGYARNYLLPRRLALPATRGNMSILEQHRGEIERKQEQHRAEARALADRLAGLSLDFPGRVGEQGRLYGSVTAQDIAGRLRGDAGIELDRRTIELKEPLRALGQYDVPIRIAHAVSGHIKVTLRDQNAAPEPETATTGADQGPEALGEDAVPLGASATDTVVPAGETAPEPFAGEEQGSGEETPA